VNERKIGELSARLRAHSPRTISYILYSQSATKLKTQLTSFDQISTEAQPREKEEVFIVTIPYIDLPEDLKRSLRPGLTGRANIVFDWHPAIWWASRHFVEWIRLKILH
jgi:hypothetical protein